MGAVVMNGAQVVGSNCIVGAGALVAEKAVVPDQSPSSSVRRARKIRDNDDATIRLHRIFRGSSFQTLAQAYAESFKRIG